MDFKEFIKPELLLLIPVCYALGLWFKQIESFKNWLIPFVLCAFSVGFSFLYLLATEFTAVGNLVAAYFFTAMTQGILCAAAAVFAANLIKQSTYGKEVDEAGTRPE